MFTTSTRSWGWYDNLKDAQTALDNDTFSMSEGLYDYAVIEEATSGIPAYCEPIEWRKYKNNNWVVITEIPKRFEGTINYGLG